MQYQWPHAVFDRLFFIITDGAELLLDLGCNPSLIGKKASLFYNCNYNLNHVVFTKHYTTYHAACPLNKQHGWQSSFEVQGLWRKKEVWFGLGLSTLLVS